MAQPYTQVYEVGIVIAPQLTSTAGEAVIRYPVEGTGRFPACAGGRGGGLVDFWIAGLPSPAASGGDALATLLADSLFGFGLRRVL